MFLPDRNKLNAPFKHEEMVAKIFCTNCGSIHELSLINAQILNLSIDDSIKEDYEDYFFQTGNCNHCTEKATYVNLELKKLSLLQLYNEICSLAYQN